MIRFDNSFVRELPGDPEPKTFTRAVHNAAYSRVMPTPVKAPKTLATSSEVAELLDFDDEFLASQEFADVFAGNALLPGMEPYAACYGGHQFGNWAGQLGDGRAMTLGELINKRGERWELQLKGAGPTPYSRRADGRAVLRSSVREFLCSEAMFHLGVPTTRALSLVETGDKVVRDMFYDGNAAPEPGAVVCRVAPSFVRFGNFELFASREDDELLKTFTDFVIRRDYSELIGLDTGTHHATFDQAKTISITPEIRAAWFQEVCSRTAKMVIDWMRVGFVHGVMNTDNMSILGLTIDYGPYGWTDNFDLDWTPNTTDAGGKRYRFGNQIPIAHWNLVRLANALYPVFGEAGPLEAALDHFVDQISEGQAEMMAHKLGFGAFKQSDEELIESLFELLGATETDMTIFFRSLSDLDLNSPSTAVFQDAFYSAKDAESVQPRWQEWVESYVKRARMDNISPEIRKGKMDAVNPRYVLRNYMAQMAIDKAKQGDASLIHELLDLLRDPYRLQPERDNWFAKRPDWARHKAGCSMLSCSS